MKNETVHYKARWIYPVGTPPIENGVVTVSQGRILYVGDKRTAEDQGKWFDLGDGVLFPALINAHTHLDLSALKGHLNPGLGFLPWVKRLLALRESITDHERRSAIQTAVEALHQWGTIAVCDWSTGLDSDGFNRLNGLIRCGFHEILGFAEQPPVLPKALNPNSEPRTPNSEPSFSSLGAHAPHTTSPALLKWAKAWSTAQGLPLSIHVAESWEEEEFLLTGQGPWRDFLEERGKWSDHWTAPKLGPVAYLNSLGILDNNTQCIHLTRADLNDLAILKNKKARPVICPRSNRFISGSLPPLPQMVQWGLDPALGTDSLASNRDLNLWKEMAFVHRSFPQIDPEMILQMATLNGARSIGLNHKLGSLAQGKDAAMLFLPLDIQASKDLPEGILASKGEKMQWIDDKKN